MSWFRQNRFLGSALIGFIMATIVASFFLLREKGVADYEQARFESVLAERNPLRRRQPFPSAANLRKIQAQVQSYRDSLGAIEQELKARSLPVVPLQPGEFQARLRQAVNSMQESARSKNVRLPDHFYLGFDEYATSLPNALAAPLLGQELEAIAMVAEIAVNAQVDALTNLTRTPLPEENPAAGPIPDKGLGRRGASGTKAAEAAPVISAHAFDFAFSASPMAAHQVLNCIAAAKEQLFIIRTLNVKNQVENGPARGSGVISTAAAPATGPADNVAAGGIRFIVGTEHLDVKATVEIINPLPKMEAR